MPPQLGSAHSETPDDCRFLPCDYSDGMPLYPTNLEKHPAADGSYDYYSPVPAGAAKDVMWRTKCGNYVYQLFSKPESAQDQLDYVFAEFPRNYKLFEHIKCTAKDGILGKERSDTYLYGHPSGKRYRSPAEYFPHIAHLSRFSANKNPDEKEKSCQCCLCSTGGAKNGPGSASASKGSVQFYQKEIKRVKMVVAQEEKIAEQDCGGWVIRKGEIGWVWLPDNHERSYEGMDWKNLVDGQDGSWAAGIVVERPGYTPFLTPPNVIAKTREPEAEHDLMSTFVNVEKDIVPPWATDKDSYTLQLCAQKGKNGEVIKDVKQWFVRPWLSRPECAVNFKAKKGEHPSVAPGREAASTFSVFDKVPDSVHYVTEVGETDKCKVASYNGIYLGAEKIWIDEPIRIKCFTEGSKVDGAEDMMVVKSIQTYTSPSKVSAGKSTTRIVFGGPIFTAFPRKGTQAVLDEASLQLPPRMRRSCGGDWIIKWHIPDGTNEKSRVVLKDVLGRYYEPQAIQVWSGRHDLHYGEDPTLKILPVDLRGWAKSRLEAFGCTILNGLDLSAIDIDDKMESKIGPARLYTQEVEDTPSDREDVMEMDPPRGFVSVNVRTVPNITPRKREISA
ncbi:hypothetical protein L873DRAFT_1666471 [Choiromyces venosus 120613-1]|uniref:Cryptic loci regulator 2 N-terminal domain-containing protein n=1 Tax=Choiromyces venosus 120613-1 TaxID=1336337 RepID=A0A3N4KEM8_9PEZI|nr:hypothetical protein L873DRAFT_1666471 [Choiromyces venosus 120613-1]